MPCDIRSSDVADDDDDKVQYVQSCALRHHIWPDFSAGIQKYIPIQYLR